LTFIRKYLYIINTKKDISYVNPCELICESLRAEALSLIWYTVSGKDALKVLRYVPGGVMFLIHSSFLLLKIIPLHFLNAEAQIYIAVLLQDISDDQPHLRTFR
jgi:hypothetical protein